MTVRSLINVFDGTTNKIIFIFDLVEKEVSYGLRDIAYGWDDIMKMYKHYMVKKWNYDSVEKVLKITI